MTTGHPGYGVGSLGSSISTFLEPIYKDTAQHMSLPLLIVWRRLGSPAGDAGTGAAGMQQRESRCVPGDAVRSDTAFNVSVRDAGRG